VIATGQAPREPKIIHPSGVADKNGAITDYRALLIFDSKYDTYRGVVAYVRIFNGSFKKGDKIKLLATRAESEILDCGIFKPDYLSTPGLHSGEIGYIVTGFKTVGDCRVGDTVTLDSGEA